MFLEFLMTFLIRFSQFHSEPPEQQDREHRPPSEPPHEVRCVHQELVPE